MKNTQKGFVTIGIVIAIVTVLAIAGVVIYTAKQKAEVNTQVEQGSTVDVSGDVQVEVNSYPIPGHSAPDQDLIDQIQEEKAEGKK